MERFVFPVLGSTCSSRLNKDLMFSSLIGTTLFLYLMPDALEEYLYSPPYLQHISYIFCEYFDLSIMAVPMSKLTETGLFDKLIKMKYDVPNNKLEMLDEDLNEIDATLASYLRK